MTVGAPDRLPFFVYGTLRPGGRNHAWALDGRTRSERPARMTGMLLYDGPGYPYAVSAPRLPDAVIHGNLVVPRPEHYGALLALLDRLEGYAAGATDHHYERVIRPALPEGGPMTRAWIYVAAAPLAARLSATGTPIPDGHWPRQAGRGAP